MFGRCLKKYVVVMILNNDVLRSTEDDAEGRSFFVNVCIKLMM